MSDTGPIVLWFIYPTARIRVCKIRFVSTGENHGEKFFYRHNQEHSKQVSGDTFKQNWIVNVLPGAVASHRHFLGKHVRHQH